MYRRLPPGCLLRDEITSSVYLVIKADIHPPKNIVYYLCCIHDPSSSNLHARLKYYFMVDYERIEKYTLLNTDVKINTDGTLQHTLSTVRDEELDSLSNNHFFMLRFLTACKDFSKEKRVYKVVNVSKETKEIEVQRKTSFFEKIILNASTLGFSITWRQLLQEYLPLIPDKLDEKDFVKSVNRECYYCLTSN